MAAAVIVTTLVHSVGNTALAGDEQWEYRTFGLLLDPSADLWFPQPASEDSIGLVFHNAPASGFLTFGGGSVCDGLDLRHPADIMDTD